MQVGLWLCQISSDAWLGALVGKLAGCHHTSRVSSDTGNNAIISVLPPTTPRPIVSIHVIAELLEPVIGSYAI